MYSKVVKFYKQLMVYSVSLKEELNREKEFEDRTRGQFGRLREDTHKKSFFSGRTIKGGGGEVKTP